MKTFEELLDAISEFDMDAADWLFTNILCEDQSGCLMSIMAWCETPQGHNYWSTIDYILADRGFYA